MVSDKGYIIVSGCPRSGTSVMMDIHRAMYGDDKILGTKFPQQARKDRKKLLAEGNSLEAYFQDKEEQMAMAGMTKEERDFMDMNPNGFWECRFSVQGIQYHNSLKPEFEAIAENWKICKIVSQGLNHSDPKYMNKVVFMLRHPRSVAKSQERLKRDTKVINGGKVYDLFEKLVIHSPEMFIQVTIQAMRFFLNNKDLPYLIVNFDELMADPKKWIKTVYEFNDVPGDLEAAYDIVEPKLNRSKHKDIENILWEDAELLYEAMCEFKETGSHEILAQALETMQDPKRNYHRKNDIWNCYRAKRKCNFYTCQGCTQDLNIRRNFKTRSEAVEGDSWKKEPCPFECGKNPDLEYPLTVEESIESNFWEVDKPLIIGVE